MGARARVWATGAGLLAVWTVMAVLRLAQWAHTEVRIAPVRVRIDPGMSATEAVARLAEAGVFVRAWPAIWALRLWGRPGLLKAGTYRLEGPHRPVDVFRVLAEGRVEQVSVTLPEGLTARQMAGILGRAGVTDAEAFAALVYDPGAPARWDLPGPSLEGFLFPDTYRFARGLAPERVVSVLVGRFLEVAEPLRADAEKLGLGLLGWVTLASMVEAEAARDEERPLVAAVFLNRLRKGMRLESDPTVIYGLQGFDGNLTRTDLERDHPYNTYTRAGLPPGPICNPGRASLQAAARPARVDFLYFVSRNDGTHVFSRTYREHLRWVERFQKGGRPR